jgi:hypothetical protein
LAGVSWRSDRPDVMPINCASASIVVRAIRRYPDSLEWQGPVAGPDLRLLRATGPSRQPSARSNALAGTRTGGASDRR